MFLDLMDQVFQILKGDIFRAACHLGAELEGMS